MANPSKVKKDERIRVFCREYIKDFNGARAARAAGYAAHSARITAAKLLTKPNVQALLQKLALRRETKQLMEGDEILAEIQNISKSDIRKAFKDDGSLKKIHELDDATAAAIAGVKIKEIRAPFTGEVIGHTKEFKFWDKNKALEMQAKNKKLLTDKLQVDGNINTTVTVVDLEQMKKLKKEFDDKY